MLQLLDLVALVQVVNKNWICFWKTHFKQSVQSFIQGLYLFYFCDVIQKRYFMQSSFDVNPNSKEVISPAISKLKFPFHLKGHQLEAVDAWISNGLRGSIIYSSGTGKTEIAFECARGAADIISGSSMNILLLVQRIVLIVQYLKRLLTTSINRNHPNNLICIKCIL
jgi:hypothetical protein